VKRRSREGRNAVLRLIVLAFGRFIYIVVCLPVQLDASGSHSAPDMVLRSPISPTPVGILQRSHNYTRTNLDSTRVLIDLTLSIVGTNSLKMNRLIISIHTRLLERLAQCRMSMTSPRHIF